MGGYIRDNIPKFSLYFYVLTDSKLALKVRLTSFESGKNT